jgi:PHP family Zn ribbon phosphoesterase
MKVKFKQAEIKPKQKVFRMCVGIGHYGSTYCSACKADAENHFDKCAKCGAVFIKTVYDDSSSMGGSDF